MNGHGSAFVDESHVPMRGGWLRQVTRKLNDDVILSNTPGRDGQIRSG